MRKLHDTCILQPCKILSSHRYIVSNSATISTGEVLLHHIEYTLVSNAGFAASPACPPPVELKERVALQRFSHSESSPDQDVPKIVLRSLRPGTR